MADNVNITPGAGAVVATDDVGGAQYQRMKLSDGTPDSTNHAVVDERGNLLTALGDIAIAVRSLLAAIVRPMWTNPSTGAVRTEIGSGVVTTVTTVTTCSTVTTLSQLGGMAIKDVMVDHLMRSSWALNIRPRIT